MVHPHLILLGMPFWQWGPNLWWLACLRNRADVRKGCKDRSLVWESLTKTVPHLLGENVPAEWPLLVSLGSQYMCNILLSLIAPHLHWFQKFYDLNYATDEICLPYFGCTVPGFNQLGNLVVNPHYFDELFFLKIEQQIKKESVFITNHTTSVSQNDSDSDKESPYYAPPSSHITPLGSFMAISANLAVTDLIMLGFL